MCFTFSVKMNIGDLQSEECRDIILKLKIDQYSSVTAQCLLLADVNYFNVISTTLRRESGSLKITRSGLFSISYIYEKTDI